MRKTVLLTFVLMLLFAIMLTLFVGCDEGENEKKYSIKMNNENWLYEKLPSSAFVGDKVSVKIKFATDLGYIFMVNGERIKQDDNVESGDYWQFSFTMPNEDVVIDFKTYDGFLPTPEYGTLIETYLIQNPDSEYVRVREYYGEYNSGAIVAMIDEEEYTSNEWSEEVAGCNFVYGDGNRLKVLYEGKFYTLPQAYEKEHLTKENVSEIFSKYSANHAVAYGDSTTQEILRLWQTFEYDGVEYDLSEIYSGVNGVSKWGEIGKYVIAEGHVNPYNSIYAVIDTETKTMENSFAGSAPTCYNEDINTVVYAFWNTVKKYDGSVLAELDFNRGEFISELSYTKNGESIKVTISNDDVFVIDVHGNILEIIKQKDLLDNIDEQVEISYDEIRTLVDLDYTFTNYTHYASDLISFNQEEYVIKDPHMYYFKITDPDLDTWADWEEFCQSIYCSDLLDTRMGKIKNNIINVDGYAYVAPGGQGRPMSTDYECNIIEQKDGHVVAEAIYIDIQEDTYGKEIIYTYEFEYTKSGWRIASISR